MSKFVLSLVVDRRDVLRRAGAESKRESQSSRPAAASLLRPKTALVALTFALLRTRKSSNQRAREMESNRTDGFFCESWDNTDARGYHGAAADSHGHV
jgi:hypothetical protein